MIVHLKYVKLRTRYNSRPYHYIPSERSQQLSEPRCCRLASDRSPLEIPHHSRTCDLVPVTYLSIPLNSAVPQITDTLNILQKCAIIKYSVRAPINVIEDNNKRIIPLCCRDLITLCSSHRSSPPPLSEINVALFKDEIRQARYPIE